MSEQLALKAASEWASANSGCALCPIQFGKQVAAVYLACEAVTNMYACLPLTSSVTELSARLEMLQALVRPASLVVPTSEAQSQTDSPDSQG